MLAPTAAVLGIVTAVSGCSSESAGAGRYDQPYAGGAWQLSFHVVVNKTQASDPYGQRGVPLVGRTILRIETDSTGLVLRSHAQSLDETGLLWEETITSESQRLLRNWHLCRLTTLSPQETVGAEVLSGLAGPEDPPSTAQTNSDGSTVWRYSDGVVDVQVTQQGADRFARTLQLFASGTEKLLVTYSGYEFLNITPSQVFADRPDEAAFARACPRVN